MLKLLEKYEANGFSIEIFQTQHSGPDYHVRYGLQTHSFDTLFEAQAEFDGSIEHARAYGPES